MARQISKINRSEDGDNERQRKIYSKKIKMKKKGKLEGHGLHDNNVTKKKKKKTVEKEEENELSINTVYKKRKRKESENDWMERYKSNAEIIHMKANSERKEAQDELVTNKTKRKYEKEVKEYILGESPVPRRKKKKKKEKTQEREKPYASLNFEHSFMYSPPVTERRDESGERIEVENLDAITQHTFLKPLPVQENRGGSRDKTNSSIDKGSRKGRGKEGMEEEEQEKSNSKKSKRRKEEEEAGQRKKEKPKSSSSRKVIDEDKNEKSQNMPDQKEGTMRKKLLYPKQKATGGDKKEKQILNTSEQQKEMTKMTRPRGITSRLAYSGLHGWETDTSTDDLDYSDDQYHLSPAAIRNRVMEERRRPTLQSTVLYSEGEEVEGFVPDPRYSSDNCDEEWIPVEVSPDERSSPGFVVKQREIPTLEEALYKFPPGVGVPPEEVEEVDDTENYWIVKERDLQPSSFAEEAKAYIDNKIAHVEDYFERLQDGQLSPAELKEARPDNFDEPFYPTPRQLKLLDTLSIRVDWQLSDLHKYHLHTLTLPHKTRAQWSGMNLFADTSRFTLREDKIIVRNWFAFQKEYRFYDLRPLVSVRTARLVQEYGQMVVQPYEYLSHANKVHFLLYLAKDLPTRTLRHVSRRILKLLPFLRGRCLLRQSQRVTGLMLAQLLYVMQLFGIDMLAAELLVGRSLRSYYSRCFALHIMLRNVKLRVGPWRQQEDERFLRGLKEVLHVRSYKEAYMMRRVPWMAIFPYVRTRSINYMRRRLIVLVSREGEKEQPSATRKLMAKFIRLLYSEQVDDFTHLDWEGMAMQVGAANPIRLVWSFRKLYFNYIPYQHRITVSEGLKYMHEHLLPFYEGFDARIIPQPGDPDFQEHQHTHHLDLTNIRNNSSNDLLPNPIHDPRSLGTDSPDIHNDHTNPSMVSDMPNDPEIDFIHPDIESSNPNNEPWYPRIDNKNSDGSNRTVSKSFDSSYSKKNRITPGDSKNRIAATYNKDDHRNQTMTNPSQENLHKNIKKFDTNHSLDIARFRKVRQNPQDPRILENFNTVYQQYFNKLKTHFNKNSSSDDDDDDFFTSSDSDEDDFELETLGQAVQRFVSRGRKK